MGVFWGIFGRFLEIFCAFFERFLGVFGRFLEFFWHFLEFFGRFWAFLNFVQLFESQFEGLMCFIRRAGVTAKRPAAQVNVLADRWLAGGLPTATADCAAKNAGLSHASRGDGKAASRTTQCTG